MNPKQKSHWGGVSSEDLERGEYKHRATEEEGYGDHGTDLGMGAPEEPAPESESKSKTEKKS